MTDVVVKIAGKEFREWVALSLTDRMDGIATASFDAPFEPSQPEFRAAFRPLSFEDVEIIAGGRAVFTGTMLSSIPYLKESEGMVKVQCYSLPGVLSDCTMPASCFPLEFSDATLGTIASMLCEPFGVSAYLDLVEDKKIHDTVSLGLEDSPLELLVGLAKQRNLLMQADRLGGLRFWRPADDGLIAAYLVEGESPLLSVTADLQPQAYFSDITATSSDVPGGSGASFVVRNPSLASSLRPLTFNAGDALNAGELKTSAEAKAARMYANAIGYSVTIATWGDLAGIPLSAGEFVQLHSPRAFVYEPYLFQIREITLNKTDRAETADMSLIIPGTLSGKIPGALPWD